MRELEDMSGARETSGPSYDNAGCALAGASASAAVLIALAFGLLHPSLIIIAFPFALLVTFLIGAIIGVPLFLVAMHHNLVTWWSATLAGSIAGIALPLASALTGGGNSWAATFTFGLAGAVAGLVFWSLLLERAGDRWD